MERCSRWFYSGDALARSIDMPHKLPTAEDVTPRVPRSWEACPVCGQFVSLHPEWTAQIVYDDGIALFFDGPNDLFRFLLSPLRSTTGPKQISIAGIFVTSYSDGRVIDGRRACFVIGSDVLGPMGAELVPFGSIDEAREFSRHRGGTEIVSFQQVEARLLDPRPVAGR